MRKSYFVRREASSSSGMSSGKSVSNSSCHILRSGGGGVYSRDSIAGKNSWDEVWQAGLWVSSRCGLMHELHNRRIVGVRSSQAHVRDNGNGRVSLNIA